MYEVIETTLKLAFDLIQYNSRSAINSLKGQIFLKAFQSNWKTRYDVVGHRIYDFVY